MPNMRSKPAINKISKLLAASSRRSVQRGSRQPAYERLHQQEILSKRHAKEKESHEKKLEMKRQARKKSAERNKFN